MNRRCTTSGTRTRQGDRPFICLRLFGGRRPLTGLDTILQRNRRSTMPHRAQISRHEKTEHIRSSASSTPTSAPARPASTMFGGSRLSTRDEKDTENHWALTPPRVPVTQSEHGGRDGDRAQAPLPITRDGWRQGSRARDGRPGQWCRSTSRSPTSAASYRRRGTPRETYWVRRESLAAWARRCPQALGGRPRDSKHSAAGPIDVVCVARALGSIS